MWYLIPTILCLAYVHGYHQIPVKDPYSAANMNQNRATSNLRQHELFVNINPFDGRTDVYQYHPNIDYSDGVYPDYSKKTYYHDLELVENFGNYLRRQTQLDAKSTAINDAAHQYNALMSVIISLARVIRNSCEDFNEIYDQVYQETVDKYYDYGLQYPDKVRVIIEDYIRRGNSHISKLRKLKQEECAKSSYCPISLQNIIKSSALLYVKELETLDAIAHLARSFFPHIEEFNKAAQKGTMLNYLQNGKDRLKEYVMHVVNSVEHLTDEPVRCS